MERPVSARPTWLHAIGNYLRQQAPEIQVRYLTAENFAAIFRSVLRNDTIQDFKEDLRRSDVLLIDDVQFLQNKVKTEEEFFHTFNHLHEAGRQLVITCDRTPRELDQLADRLRERFESGLVVEIEKPDDRLRAAILRKRVRVDNIPVDDDLALDRIAERVPSNVRSLEGALIRVSAFASMRDEPVTTELVDELLDSLHPHTAGTQDRAPQTRGLDPRDPERGGRSLRALDRGAARQGPQPSRRRPAPDRDVPRRASTAASRCPTIAAAFGRDHSTVVHARDKVRAAHRNDPAAADAVDSLKAVIHGAERPTERTDVN